MVLTHDATTPGYGGVPYIYTYVYTYTRQNHTDTGPISLRSTLTLKQIVIHGKLYVSYYVAYTYCIAGTTQQKTPPSKIIPVLVFPKGTDKSSSPGLPFN